MADHCCTETGCTRKHPMLVRPSGLLPGRWYVLTRYIRQERDGQADLIMASQKHALDEETCRALTRGQRAVEVLREMVAFVDEFAQESDPDLWQRAREVLGDG